MLGALISGLCFASWTSAAVAGQQPVGTITDYFLGVGVIVMSLGAATLSSVRASSPALRRKLGITAEGLPLAAIVSAVVLALTEDIPSRLRAAVWLMVAVLLVTNGVRQVLLIRSQRRAQVSLRKLAAELSNAEESERRNIATYLHDGVGQSLAVMSLKFGEIRASTDGAQREKLLDEIDSMLARAADEVQSSTYDISPPTLYELGLVAAIRRCAETLHKEFSIDIQVVDDEMQRAIDKNVAPLLYRFVRELLLNVVKHANASKVSVELGQGKLNTYINVCDDGDGFDVKALDAPGDGGFGLYSILERTRAIGGRFTIQSDVGSGTIASIRIPTTV